MYLNVLFHYVIFDVAFFSEYNIDYYLFFNLFICFKKFNLDK